jgi:hypothetical protein
MLDDIFFSPAWLKIPPGAAIKRRDRPRQGEDEESELFMEPENLFDLTPDPAAVSKTVGPLTSEGNETGLGHQLVRDLE